MTMMNVNRLDQQSFRRRNAVVRFIFMTEIQFNQVGEHLIIGVKKLRFLSSVERFICAIYGQWREHDNVHFVFAYVDVLHFDTFHFDQLSVKLNLSLQQKIAVQVAESALGERCRYAIGNHPKTESLFPRSTWCVPNKRLNVKSLNDRFP